MIAHFIITQYINIFFFNLINDIVFLFLYKEPGFTLPIVCFFSIAESILFNLLLLIMRVYVSNIYNASGESKNYLVKFNGFPNYILIKNIDNSFYDTKYIYATLVYIMKDLLLFVFSGLICFIAVCCVTFGIFAFTKVEVLSIFLSTMCLKIIVLKTFTEAGVLHYGFQDAICCYCNLTCQQCQANAPIRNMVN
jgi:hypothetical protein